MFIMGLGFVVKVGFENHSLLYCAVLCATHIALCLILLSSLAMMSRRIFVLEENIYVNH
jgi:hypothetical protein